MNESIRQMVEQNHEVHRNGRSWELTQIVSDVTENGITIKDNKILQVNVSNIYRSAMEMFGETSPAILSGSVPCMIPEYIEYRCSLMEKARELYPRNKK